MGPEGRYPLFAAAAVAGVATRDPSVFASSGGAQPSQTIMALAARLADHLDRSRSRASRATASTAVA